MDSLAEKYYGISPYAYCNNNPVIFIDPDGKDSYYTPAGQYIGKNLEETDVIYILDNYKFIKNLKDNIMLISYTGKTDLGAAKVSAKVLSKILTDIVTREGNVTKKDLHNGQISVCTFKQEANLPEYDDQYNDPSTYYNQLASNGCAQKGTAGKTKITATFHPVGSMERSLYRTVSNVCSLLVDHEYKGHFKNGLIHDNTKPDKVFEFQKKQSWWKGTTPDFKQYENSVYQ